MSARKLISISRIRSILFLALTIAIHFKVISQSVDISGELNNVCLGKAYTYHIDIIGATGPFIGGGPFTGPFLNILDVRLTNGDFVGVYPHGGDNFTVIWSGGSDLSHSISIAYVSGMRQDPKSVSTGNKSFTIVPLTTPESPGQIIASINNKETDRVCSGEVATFNSKIPTPSLASSYDFIWEYHFNGGGWQSYTTSTSDVIAFPIPLDATLHNLEFRVKTRYKDCPTMTSEVAYSKMITIIPPPPPINSVSVITPLCPDEKGSITINHGNVQAGVPYAYTLTQYVSGDAPCLPSDNALNLGNAVACGSTLPSVNPIGGKYYCKGNINSYSNTFNQSGAQSYAIASLEPGIYEVEVEAAGYQNISCICRYFFEIPSAPPKPPIPDPVIKVPSCFGGNDGSATVSLSAIRGSASQINYTLTKGTSTVQGVPYNQPNGPATPTLNPSNQFVIDNLSAGTYYLTVRDACVNDAITKQFNVNNGNQITLTLTSSAISPTCNSLNGSNGSITLRTNLNGTMPSGMSFLYELYSSGGDLIKTSTSGQGSSFTFSELSDLTYYGRVKTSSGCQADATSGDITLKAPASLTMGTPTHSNILCSSKSDAQITLTDLSKQDGDINYSYTLTKDKRDVVQSGIITSGGNLTIPNLDFGKYTIVVTDHCDRDATLSANVEIEAPMELTMKIDHTDASCSSLDSGNGSITLTDLHKQSGTIDYSYTLIKEGTSGQVAENNNIPNLENKTISNLAAGKYTLKVTDNCTTNVPVNYNIEIVGPTALTMDVSHTDATCSNLKSGNGSITLANVKKVRGEINYSYAVKNGDDLVTQRNVNSSEDQIIVDLAAGVYVVTVTDLCTTTVPVVYNVTIAGPTDLTMTIINTNSACANSKDASITLTNLFKQTGDITYSCEVTKGVELVYQQSNINALTDLIIPNLDFGAYTVTVIDHCNSDARKVTNVMVGAPTELVMTITTTNPTCSNSTDASITLTNVSREHGNINYSYILKEAGVTVAQNNVSGADDQIMSGLEPGVYELSITDNCNPGLSPSPREITITAPPPIAIQPINDILTCYGGVVQVNVDVSSSLKYSLNVTKNGVSFMGSPNVSGGTTFTDLTVDNTNSYTVTATESCPVAGTPVVFDQKTFIVKSSSDTKMTATITKKIYSNTYNLTCRDRNDGALYLTVYGGFAGPSDAPQYAVEVYNGQTILLDNQHNNNNSNGAISNGVSDKGGYTYIISGLTHSVEYNIRVSDASPNACQTIFTLDADNHNLVLSAPQALTIAVPDPHNDFENQIIDSNDGFMYVKCKEDANINFTTFFSGGTSPFMVNLLKADQRANWIPFRQTNNVTSTSAYFTSLASGNYKIQLTDQFGCTTAERTFSIYEPDNTPIIPEPVVTRPSCNGGNNGIAIFTLTTRGNYNAGNAIKYTVKKDASVYHDLQDITTNLTAGNQLVVDNLIAGANYELTVWDVCSGDPMTKKFSVVAGSNIVSLAGVGVDPTCLSGTTGNGTINFTATVVSGMTYAFTLYGTNGDVVNSSSSGQSNVYAFSNLKDGAYYSIVQTSNACQAQSASVVLRSPGNLTLTPPTHTNAICSNSTDANITLKGFAKQRGDINYSYTVIQGGTQVFHEDNITTQGDHLVPKGFGSGIYTISVTDNCKPSSPVNQVGVTITSPTSIVVQPVNDIWQSCYEGIASTEFRVISTTPTYTLNVSKNGVSLKDYPRLAITGGGIVTDLSVDNSFNYVITATENCPVPNTPLVWNDKSFAVKSNAAASITAVITKHVYANNQNLTCSEVHDGIIKMTVHGGYVGGFGTTRYIVNVLNGATVLIDNQSNNNNGNGSISNAVSDNGGYTFTISGLTQGINYSIKVQDFNTNPQPCEKTFSHDVGNSTLLLTAPAPLVIAVPDLINDFENKIIKDGVMYVKCKGDADINFTSYFSGGSAPYTVNLSKKDQTGNWIVFKTVSNVMGTSAHFIGLVSGNYKVNVVDQFSCAVAERTFDINEAQQPLTIIGIDAYHDFLHGQNTRCYDTDDAQITLTAEGGVGPYTYQMTGSDGSNRKISDKPLLTQTYAPLPALDHAHGNTAITYTIYLTDALGCTWSPATSTERVVTLSAPAPVAFTPGVVSATSGMYEILCKGDAATVHVTSYGGAFKHDLLVNDVVKQQTIEADNVFEDFPMIAGSYTMKVRDAEGCESLPQVVMLDEPSTEVKLTTVSVTAPKCIGGNDGKIVISGSGGVSGITGQEYFFQIKPEGAAAFDAFQFGKTATFVRPANGYTSQKYIVRVSDSHQCYDERTIEMPVTTTPLTLTLNGTTDPSCYGASNAKIQVTASNYAGTDLTFKIAGGHLGTTTQEFKINNASTYTFLNLQGTDRGSNVPYRVWVEDVNACAVMAYQYLPGLILSSPTPVSVIANPGSPNRPSCYSGTDGSIDVAVAGGTPPYYYSPDNITYQRVPSTTILLSDLASGNYPVYLRDSHYDPTQASCQSKENFTVEPGRIIRLDAIPNTITCKGGNDGAIDLTVAVENRNANESFNPGQLNLSWTHDDISSVPLSPAIEDLGALYAGTYTVHARYTVGSQTCANEKTVTVIEPVRNFKINEVEVYAAACGSQHKGRAVVGVSGGWPLLLTYYSLDQSPWKIFSGSSFVLMDLSAGEHTVRISQGAGNGCTDTYLFTIEHSKLSLVISKVNPPSCPGASDGSVIMNSNDHTAWYALQAGSPQPLGVFTNLSAGKYHFVALQNGDATCYSEVADVLIQDPIECGKGPLQVQIATPLPATCQASNDGMAQVIASGGVTPYRYYWDGNTTAGNAKAMNLSPGNHTVKVQDAVGSFSQINLTVGVLETMKAQAFATQASCLNTCDGGANIVVTGGSGQHTITWTTDAKTEFHRTDLCVGTYEYSIYDKQNAGCFLTQNVVIEHQPVLAVQVKDKSPTCPSGKDGEANVIFTGGSGHYSFQWSTGLANQNLSGVGAGAYSVSVTDAVLGCTLTENITVSDPPAITINTTTSIAPQCHGGSDGKIMLGLTNVVNPLVKWSNGQIGAEATGFKPGVYSYTVTGSNGCQITGTAEVEDRAALVVNAVSTAPLCNSNCNGTVSLAVLGGSAPYFVSWSHGPRGVAIDNLCSGLYTYTITDRYNCKLTKAITLTAPEPLSITGETKNPSCYGNKDGTIALTVKGGVGNYNYVWSNDATLANLDGLGRGAYTVTVSDANACATNQIFTLIQPTLFQLSSTVINPTCSGFTNGQIESNLSGGTQPYAYTWEDGSSTPLRQQLGSGTYSLSIRDSKGCVMQKRYTLSTASTLELMNEQVRPPACAGDKNGSISVSVTGGVLPYTYVWNNGINTNAVNELTAGTYALEVKDKNACSVKGMYTLIDPPRSTVTGIAEETTICKGSVVTLSPEGLWSRYEWTGPQNSKAVTNKLETAIAGSYTLTVWDARNCITKKDFTIAISSSALSADFLRISEAIVNEPIVFLDISFPIPEQIEWLIPQDDDVHVNQSTSGMVEITFTRTDDFEIGMKSRMGNCEASLYKRVAIREKEASDNPGGRVKEQDLLNIKVYPNPADDHVNILILAPDSDEITMDLISVGDNHAIAHQKLEGKRDYLINLNIQDAKAGVYHLICEYRNKIFSKKIAVIR